MLVKCICTNCAGHLEFEEENAGESIRCPHCGFETTLALPGSKSPDEEQEYFVIRKQALLRWLLRIAVVVVVFGVGGWVLYRWGVPWIQDRFIEIETTGGAMVILIGLCLVVPFVVFWLIFPVLLFFQLRKLTGVLAQIAGRSNTDESAGSAPEEKSLASEQEKEKSEA
jgi:hypothetical protein